jgi:hypothetical protein
MILNNNFDKVVQSNFLRGTREYDLASFFWDKAERAMQGKPTQEPILIKPKLKELLESTKALQDYFTEIQWVKPKLEQHEPKTELTRSEIQSLIAGQRKRIGELEEDVFSYKGRITAYNEFLLTLEEGYIPVSVSYTDLHLENYHRIRNCLTTTKRKLEKAVKLQRKLKKMLAKP